MIPLDKIILENTLGGIKMNNTSTIPPHHLFFILVGTLIGPGFFRLPSALIKIAKQDAWISAILGLIYPFTITLLCVYIINNAETKGIASISKMYLGNLIGSITCFFFIIQYIFFFISMMGDFIIMFSTYVVGFLTPVKILIVAFIVSIYTISKDIETLAKVNEISVYLLAFLIALSLFSFKYLDILNIQPILGSGLKNIIKASKQTFYFYLGPEILLYFYPFVSPSKGIKKWSLLAVSFSSVVWILCCLITVLYLGVEVSQKSNWPFIYVYESVNIKVINNFMYILIFVWAFVVYKSLSNNLFASINVLSNITKVNKKIILIILIPFSFAFSLVLSKNKFRTLTLGTVSNIFIIFNILYVLILVFLIYLNKKNKYIYKKAKS